MKQPGVARPCLLTVVAAGQAPLHRTANEVRERIPTHAFRRLPYFADRASRSILVQGSSRSLPVVARDSMSRWAWAAASSE